MVRFNLLLLSFVALFLLRSGVQVSLERLNISRLRERGDRVPEIFQDTIDREKFGRISAYTAESARLGMVSTLADQGLVLVLLLSGLLPWLVNVIHSWGAGPVAGGLLFFGVLSLLEMFLHLPFSLYGTFVIEERYGFNTKTFRLWISDLIKGTAVSAVVGGVLLWLVLSLILYAGAFWWIWAWVLVGLFELLMIELYPVVIAPLFNKFEPVSDPALEGAIRSLAEKAGLRVKGIFKMDASKRSRHTNAYFTGIGKSKRIVLFDTLLKSHGAEELLAVLSHEIGHWKRRHVLKQLVLVEILSLAGFYIAGRCLRWPLLYRTFGFEEPVLYAGLYLLGIFFGVFGYFIQPVESAVSRKFEREADDDALVLMESPGALRRALKRLAADNLSNLIPHPLYAWFYYSHPPVVERIARLEGEASRPTGSRGGHERGAAPDRSA